MENTLFPKLTYPRLSPSTFNSLIGLDIPKQVYNSGNVGTYIHNYVSKLVGLPGTGVVDIDEYGVEVKTKSNHTKTPWTMGSMTLADIILKPYINTPFYQKSQALLLVRTDNSLLKVTDFGLHYLDFDEAQTRIEDAYEGARLALVQDFVKSGATLETIKFKNSKTYRHGVGLLEYSDGLSFKFRIQQKEMAVLKNLGSVTVTSQKLFEFV